MSSDENRQPGPILGQIPHLPRPVRLAADQIVRLREERDNARVETSMKGYRLDDALDEIERLRAEIERLQAAGDALATNYELMLEQYWSSFLEAFLYEWKEARRER